MVFSCLGSRVAVLCIHISISISIGISHPFICQCPYKLATAVMSVIGLVHLRGIPCLLLHLLHITTQLVYNT
jgi:hypothetical protein